MATGDAKRKCDWLTMIFMGADDDLRPFGDVLLNEVKLVGSTERVPIIVERDPTVPREPTRRGEVRQGKWDSEEIGLTDGDATAVIEFVNHCKTKFDADKKLLVLWDHGNGWQNVHPFKFVASIPAPLQTVALGEALDGSGVDVLCFDACLMAMIEIAYQLRRRVHYMIASENVVPADSGWPYDAILRELNEAPEMEAEDVSRMIVRMFSGAYNASHEPIALSVLDLDHVEKVVEAIFDLSRALIVANRNGGRQALLMARRYAQSFGNPDYIDLISFCSELQRRAPGKVAELAEVVCERAKKLVIAKARGSAPSIRGAHGVSIYFPDRPVSPLYEHLDFADRSGWGSFLAAVTPRPAPAKRIHPSHGAPAAPAPATHAHSCRHGVAASCAKCKSHKPRSTRRRTG